MSYKYCRYCENLIDLDDEELEDYVCWDDEGNCFCSEECYDLYWFGESEEEPLDEGE